MVGFALDSPLTGCLCALARVCVQMVASVIGVYNGLNFTQVRGATPEQRGMMRRDRFERSVTMI